MIKEQSEKRKGPRIRTALPVVLKGAHGVTRDVSASGLFFWTSEIVCELGQLINFSVEIASPKGRMRLNCQGDVVRTEPRSCKVGVAVRIVDSAMEMAQELRAERENTAETLAAYRGPEQAVRLNRPTGDS
jgi:hypothetical protein